MEMTINDVGTTGMNQRSIWQRLMASGAAFFRSEQHEQVANSESPTLRTMAPLNLRAKPSATAKIHLVIPGNSVVRPLADARNGYAKIAFGGTTGWAYDAFLADA